MSSYAIIGFGCAGYYAMKAIRETDPDGIIDIYSEHNDPPYNPMLTTYYASDRLPKDGLFPFGNNKELAASYRVAIHSGIKVQKLFPDQHALLLPDGRIKSYDRILIATGATTFVPPISNDVPAACVSIRNLEDAEKLRSMVHDSTGKRAIVVGASMAGIKVLEAFHTYGCSVELADLAPHIFPLAAYPETAHRIEVKLSAQGVGLHFGIGLTAIRQAETSPAVLFSDGSEIAADYIGLCIGTRACTSLASEAGLQTHKGILVNPSMETSAPGIYAAGDCAEGCNLQDGLPQLIGLWANAAYQGYTAGISMAGGSGHFDGNILHNMTHFFGIDFIGLGDNRIAGRHITFYNSDRDLWIEAVLNEKILVGLNILGDYRISGILKNHLLTIMEHHDPHIPDLQRGILLQQGISSEFIDALEGD